MPVWLLSVGVAAMPLGTISTCDYGPGGGTFFFDDSDDERGLLFVDDAYIPSCCFNGYDDVVIVEDGYPYYEDVVVYDYYEDAGPYGEVIVEDY